MRDENVRVRERFELSLDGRQIASIVVSALVIVGVVFVLGLGVGRHLAGRSALPGRDGDLTALDRVAETARAGAEADPLTFDPKLRNARPVPPPPREVPRVAAAAAAPQAPPPAATPASATAPSAAARTLAPPPPPSPVAQPTAAPAAAPAPARTAVPAAPAAALSPAGAFTVQLGATPSRTDAERLAEKVRSAIPRIEETDVPGKGHFFRVRVGRFETREQAERFRDDVAREHGVKGVVMAGR